MSKFYQYMRSNSSSEHHQNNNLKVAIAFANFLGKKISFYDIQRKEQVLEFLNTKAKSNEEDQDKKWITTWNNYLNRIKLFYRWLYNNSNDTEFENWQTPEFVKIKTKKSKRISPYLESEIWEREELLSIIKYEPHLRNKAALTLFWDLNGRNHEITMLKLKHIRIKENYAEGEVPHDAKTGGGPILLTLSFPYVRDWINIHPFRNSPNSSLVCNTITGAPVKPEAMWTMMHFQRLVGFNGINIAATKPDLLDRGIFFILKRIADENRRYIIDIQREFEELRPYLLGYILDILVKVLKWKEENNPQNDNGTSFSLAKIPRMVDWAYHCEIIA